MPFLEEVGQALKDANVTPTVYYSTKAGIPTGVGPYLQLIRTSGTGDLKTHDREGIAYERPTLQLMVRGESYQQTETMILNARQALSKVKNQRLLGTWYQEIILLSNIADLGMDDTSRRVRLVFNVMAVKRPS